MAEEEALNEYLSSYENLDVHQIMLKDQARNEAYKNAITSNKSKFEGKIVLDVGAGTGILSIFCAQAGAKKVLAVEATKIAKLAREIIAENHCEHIIDVYEKKIEDFQLPDNIKKVDIIISEWMGFYLLHEGMLDSLIYARNKFLKPDGLMFPENATLYIAPCTLPTSEHDWSNVNGIKMESFQKALQNQKLSKPEIITIPSENLLHEGTVIAWIDLKDVNSEDINDFQFKEVIVMQNKGRYEGVCMWFDCEFPINDDGDSIVLSTSPKSDGTHWKQTVIVLPENQREIVDERYPVAFSLDIKRNKNNTRRYDLELILLDAEKIPHQMPCNCISTKCILTKAHLDFIESKSNTIMDED